MNVIAFSGKADNWWARVTALTGITGIIAYVVVKAAEHSEAYAAALAFVFAFGITVSSIGLYYVLGGATSSRLALIAAVANVMAAGQLLAMLMIQMSIYGLVQQPDAALKAIWMGLDVAWDLYIGTGTILFALCMFRRDGFGVWLAGPGLLIGSLLLIFNVATFPIPPENAGLVDLGPVVGLWYLVVYVWVGVSAVIQERRDRRSPARESAEVA